MRSTRRNGRVTPDLRRPRGGCRRFLRLLAIAALLVACTIALMRLSRSPLVMRHLYPFTYRPSIVRNAEAQKLDPLLVAAVIKAESNFWTWARSRKDARGLMQLTPETGRWVAAQTGFAGYEDDELYNPEVNLELGCWYLAYLVREFGDALPAALAAWNGGRTNVSAWLSSGTWSGELEDAGRIPFRETRDFVRRVLDNLTWYERLYGEGIE